MSDQDTTAPGTVTIKVVADDPDRFVHSLTEAIQRELAKPATEDCGWGTKPAPRRIVGLFHVPWRRRIRKAAFVVAGAGVIALAIIGALSLW